ncbi:MAG: Mth938-like domain-containing protein [Gammaproteobacteria bacterium]|nr:Mth938-like domain-containing protein [Gammaproteobacteria bacterium]MDH4312777.1 Mth938-like domain-containing protein [Gammaproteobacteria bacterium]MDH5271989.1 Mth938-like domain-containing protein [Gammaproteobacteria bacterium]
MKLQLENPAGTNLVRSYGPGQLRIGERMHSTSLIVTATTIIAPWRPTTAQGLTAADLEPLLGLAPAVVLLGTGARQQFPDVQVLRILHDQRIGVEVMDTSAACRTYNVLVTEGRSVAAALIV